MEKDGIFPSADFNWPSNTISPPPAQVMEMNPDSGGNSSLLNLNNWEQSPAADDAQTANFESALSSLVSSPTTSSAAACNIPSPDSIVIRELIGRLGSICNNNKSNNNYRSRNDNASSSSCYATPLSSPPKLNLSIPQFPPPTPMGVGVDFVTDPGFAERAARYSCFGAARNYAQFGELSNSGQPLKENDMMMMMSMMMARPDGDLGLNANNSFKSSSSNNAREDPPPSDPIMTPSSEGNVARKRKAAFSFSSSSSSSKGSRGGGNEAHHNPPKASEDENSNSKRCKSSSAAAGAKGDVVKGPKVEPQNNNSAAGKQNGEDKESNAKPPEHPKQDYIHVRARRGQATDSHSLAERVRREKISERMKFLQDLVPGCNKVTGKAVMLDEIINYVQSLQRQVEFLSMKLATVNPRMDGVLTKDMHQPRGPMLPPHSSYPLEATSSGCFSYASQPQGHGPSLRGLMASNALETQLDASCLNRPLSMQLPSLDGFTDATCALQPGAFWEDDLHSVVQMGFVQNHGDAVSSQNFQGAPGPTGHMKIEL